MRSRGLALLLLATAGFSRCGGSSAAAAEELLPAHPPGAVVTAPLGAVAQHLLALTERASSLPGGEQLGEFRRGMTAQLGFDPLTRDRKSTRLNSSHLVISYAVFCLKKK